MTKTTVDKEALRKLVEAYEYNSNVLNELITYLEEGSQRSAQRLRSHFWEVDKEEYARLNTYKEIIEHLNYLLRKHSGGK